MSHHDNHEHAHGEPKNLGRGYFEVPLAVGAAIWIFVIMLIKLNCWGPNGGCSEKECCKKDGENCAKTEAPATHH